MRINKRLGDYDYDGKSQDVTRMPPSCDNANVLGKIETLRSSMPMTHARE